MRDNSARHVSIHVVSLIQISNTVIWKSFITQRKNHEHACKHQSAILGRKQKPQHNLAEDKLELWLVLNWPINMGY